MAFTVAAGWTRLDLDPMVAPVLKTAEREFRLYEPVRETVKPAACGPELGRSAWQRAEAKGILR